LVAWDRVEDHFGGPAVFVFFAAALVGNGEVGIAAPANDAAVVLAHAGLSSAGTELSVVFADGFHLERGGRRLVDPQSVVAGHVVAPKPNLSAGERAPSL
jgi:hypothetical protein